MRDKPRDDTLREPRPPSPADAAGRMISVQVRFFAAAADAAETGQAEYQLAPPVRLADLVELVEARHPRLAAVRGSITFAVNQEYARPDRQLVEGDVVAVIPPVSGGCGDRVELTRSPIDVAEILDWVSGDPGNGAIDLFVGATRAETSDRHGPLARLDYEAYDEMALSEMRKLVREAGSRWPVGRIALVHRIGPVGLAQASVVIAVASPHRGEAFEACRFIIDRLKETAPIWKREVWESNRTSWATGKTPDSGPR